MTTDFELCGMLLVIVLVFAFIAWDIRTQYAKQRRAMERSWERGRRRSEDEAWAAFWAAAEERRQQIEESLSAKDGMDSLIDLLNDRRVTA